MSGHRREFHLRHLADRPHAIYIVWGGGNGDEPIYVGMTSNWVTRVGSHMHYLRDGEAVHIDVWHACDSRAEAEALEEQTIRALDPRDNCQHSPTRERDRAEWEAYCAEMLAPPEIGSPMWNAMCDTVNRLPRIAS